MRLGLPPDDQCSQRGPNGPRSIVKDAGWNMTWQSVDTQRDLDALDNAVCWEDTRLLELHGGSASGRRDPVEINRRGVDGLDYHVFLQACSSLGAYLELVFVECDAFDPDVFLTGLQGRVTTLKQVEIGRGFEGIRCSRVLFRWLAQADPCVPRYWRDDLAQPDQPPWAPRPGDQPL